MSADQQKRESVTRLVTADAKPAPLPRPRQIQHAHTRTHQAQRGGGAFANASRAPAPSLTCEAVQQDLCRGVTAAGLLLAAAGAAARRAPAHAPGGLEGAATGGTHDLVQVPAAAWRDGQLPQAGGGLQLEVTQVLHHLCVNLCG